MLKYIYFYFLLNSDGCKDKYTNILHRYFNKKYSKHLRDSMRRGSKLLRKMSDRALTKSKRSSRLLKIFKGKSPAKKVRSQNGSVKGWVV